MILQKHRVLLALVVSGFLVLCHLGYLFAYAQDRQTDFSAQMNQSPIQFLSLILLIAIVIFGFIRPQSEGEDS